MSSTRNTARYITTLNIYNNKTSQQNNQPPKSPQAPVVFKYFLFQIAVA